MFTTLALTLLMAAPAPKAGYASSVSNGSARIMFTDLVHVYGPFKFYVSSGGYPDARCATCPTGATVEYTVPPEHVRQRWLSNNRGVEVEFPLSDVGGQEYFYFTAVTCKAFGEECFYTSGVVPNSVAKK